MPNEPADQSRSADLDSDAVMQKFEAALNSDAVPKIYCNGFTNTMSNADTSILLECNGRPVAIVNMSYTLAKTLSEKLGKMIVALEEAAGRTMLTTDQVSSSMSKGKEK